MADSPQKKRSLFGSFASTIFGRSASVQAEPEAPEVASSSRSRVVESHASSESPVKRATESQMQSRKIISRPQGPSNKMGQASAATDFSRLASSITPSLGTNFNNLAMRVSATALATPKRMPGDNPNKYRTLATGAAIKPPTNPYAYLATTPRNVFRGSTMQRPGFPFSPRLPASSLKENLSPSTPGKALRGSMAASGMQSLSHAGASQPLFSMKIPSPPRELSGEKLEKEAPDDHNRPGSIYADEYLAHYCPHEFTELQRRQFFCILDLRRLKHAAEEVFRSRDWRINISKFAKEYEKNRSLIMLRYGLYEFKSVRASESVVREWKEKHGIELDEDEVRPALELSKPGVKRKAEEELTPKDTALTVSTTNTTKRSRATEQGPSTEESRKNKRKADSGALEENPPNKLQKSDTTTPGKGTPSATRSFFEKIVNDSNGVGQSTTTPAKPSLKFDLSSTSQASNRLPSSTQNIFDQSKQVGNKDSPQQSEEESKSLGGNVDGGEDEETQELDTAAEENVTNGVAGPTTPEFAKPRSIFDRLTSGSDATPLRQPLPEEKPAPLAAPEKTPIKEPSTLEASKSWTTNSPIKFAPTPAQSNALFSAGAPKPALGFYGTPSTKALAATEGSKPYPDKPLFGTLNAANASITFGSDGMDAKITPKVLGGASAPAFGSPVLNFGSSAPVSTIGNSEATKNEATADAAATLTPVSAKIFGVEPQIPASNAEKPLFLSSSVADQSASLFGNKESRAFLSAPTPSIFSTISTPIAAPALPKKDGSAQAETAKAAIFQSSRTLFEGANKTESSFNIPPQPNLLFGAKSAESTAATTLSQSVFAKPALWPATNLFDATATSTASSLNGADELSAKKISFDPANGQSAPALFGGLHKPEQETPATENKSIFGQPAASSSESKNLFFGQPSAPAKAPTENLKSNFACQAGTAKPASGIFAKASGECSAQRTNGIFKFGSPNTSSTLVFAAGTSGEKPSGAPIFGLSGAAPSNAPIFGSASSATPSSSTQATFGAGANGVTSFTLGGGKDTANSFNNPFTKQGGVSAPTSFDFGTGSSNNGSGGAFVFGGGSSAGGASTSSAFNFDGNANGQAAPSISSGAALNSAPDARSNMAFGNNGSISSNMFAFGGGLAPGGGASTGTNTPFTLGGASSLATTPATGTPEPRSEKEEGQAKTEADGNDAPQEQISLIEGGPGEEDEAVVHEVRAKALKMVTSGGSEDDSGKDKDGKNICWMTQGVGPFRLLKHKTTGAVRMLMRAEPRGHVAVNRLVLADFNYKAEKKYVKVVTSTEDGAALETWVMQFKTPEFANKFAQALEEHKSANRE